MARVETAELRRGMEACFGIVAGTQHKDDIFPPTETSTREDVDEQTGASPNSSLKTPILDLATEKRRLNNNPYLEAQRAKLIPEPEEPEDVPHWLFKLPLEFRHQVYDYHCQDEGRRISLWELEVELTRQKQKKPWTRHRPAPPLLQTCRRFRQEMKALELSRQAIFRNARHLDWSIRLYNKLGWASYITSITINLSNPYLEINDNDKLRGILKIAGRNFPNVERIVFSCHALDYKPFRLVDSAMRAGFLGEDFSKPLRGVEVRATAVDTPYLQSLPVKRFNACVEMIAWRHTHPEPSAENSIPRLEAISILKELNAEGRAVAKADAESKEKRKRKRKRRCSDSGLEEERATRAAVVRGLHEACDRAR